MSNEIIKEFLEAWNEVIRGLCQARDGWERARKLKTIHNIGIESLPDDAQICLSRVSFYSKFSIMAPAFLKFTELYKPIAEFIIPESTINSLIEKEIEDA